MSTQRSYITLKDPDIRARQWLLWGGAFTSLFFVVGAHDPFNAPKSWALSIAGFWLLGFISFRFKENSKHFPLKIAGYLVIAFAAALLFAFLFTDNKYIGFFGEYQRRTGLLTYLSLLAFFLAAAYLLSIKNLDLLVIVSAVTGFIMGVYGNLQHFKLDPIHWNNPYNPVLGTVGNPDFASAIMAIFAVLNFGTFIQSKVAKWLRTVTLFNTVTLITAIYFSKALQGLISSAIGFALIILVLIWQKNPKISYSLTSLGALFGVIGILGMLNIGPLAKYLYKASVTYRGDYWRAGFKMFTTKPFTGVGLDRYGANFRSFRDLTQATRRGPDILSNAAHSIPIQLAATGGIFVFLAYLAFTLFIAWRAFVALRTSRGLQQIFTATVVGAWLAYEVQSLISIDNIGIAIWGYILGGTVVALSFNRPEDPIALKYKPILQPVASISMATLLFITSVFFFQAETAMQNLTSVAPPTDPSQYTQYERVALAPLSHVFKEQTFALSIAGYMAQSSHFDNSIALIKKIIAEDPKFYDAHSLLARIYEYQKNWKEAIPIREDMIKMDPFNNLNKEALAKDRAGLKAL